MNIADLLKMKDLIIYYAIINIKIRFKGTKLGLIWAALEPLLMFLLLYVVFTNIRERTEENFGIYLLSGVIIYHIFSRGTIAGVNSLTSNRGILQSIKIPKEFFPLTYTTATAMLMIIEIAVFFAIMPFLGFIPSESTILMPIVLILLIMLILGISFILSVIHVIIRDIQYLWVIFLNALFFATPIIWYLNDAKQLLLFIHQFNPVGQLVENTHKIIVYGQFPTLQEWIYTIIFSISILLVGYAVFRKFNEQIVENL